MKAIPTFDRSGLLNGELIPVWSNLSHGWTPSQVYVTTVLPGCMKGPHLHLVRKGRFCCVAGDVKIIKKTEQGYRFELTGEEAGHYTVHVAPGTPSAIYNPGKKVAVVLNMPSPAWRPDNQDEHPVLGWDYKP